MCPPPAVYGHTCTAGALVSSGLVDRFLHLCLPGNDDKRVCAQCWWGHPPSQKPLIGWMPHLSRVPPRSCRIWPLLPSRNDAAFGEQVILFRGKIYYSKEAPVVYEMVVLFKSCLRLLASSFISFPRLGEAGILLALVFSVSGGIPQPLHLRKTITHSLHSSSHLFS